MMAPAGVLAEEDRIAVEEQFGVGSEQVVRDHLISHVLAAIADKCREDVIFFGGTALARTHLPDLRLSEDIDLIALGNRNVIAEKLERTISRGLRRSFGVAVFAPSLATTTGSSPTVLSIDAVRIQIQLLSATGYPAWPTEVRAIEQRYGDAPEARLRVLTRPAFAAAKLGAWHDRGAARDLYDLWALARLGVIDEEAVMLFGRIGPLTKASDVSFEHVPSADEWSRQLAHQGIPRVGPEEAAAVARNAWSRR